MKSRNNRSTVSLAGIVWEMAQQGMDRKGFNGNFSAYIADLIRRDAEAAHPVAEPAKAVTEPAKAVTERIKRRAV